MVRKTWIDLLRGIGITCVVVGHNTTADPYLGLNTFIYSFHMPLFFLISGFLFTPKPPKVYLSKSAKRLLLPYAAFILVLAVPDVVEWMMFSRQIDKVTVDEFIGKWAQKAIYYKGWYTVFWFIAVLWMSTNIFNYICRWKNWKVGLPLIAIVAYIAVYIPGPLPLRIRVVPMAIVFIWIGFLLGKKFNEVIEKKSITYGLKWIVGVGIVSAALFLVMGSYMRMDMKHCIYGIPVISIFVAVMISIALAFLSLILSRHPWISKPLCLLGEASMIIMILHIPARDVIAGRINLGGSIITAIIVGIVLPVLMYLLLNRGKISRRYFLGK